MPEVKPLTPIIGAEIYDIDLRQPLALKAGGNDQLVRYKVIFFVTRTSTRNNI